MNESLVTVVRGVIAFVSLLILARVLGKQQIAELTFFEYVLGITIGSIASTMTVDLSTKIFPQFVGLLTWVGAVMVTQWVTIRWRDQSKLINGEPTIVVMEGRIMEDAMRKLRYRLSDLTEQLRIEGVFNLDEVQYAVLEASGQLSVLKKPQNMPVTLQDLQLTGQNRGMDVELVYGGVVVEQNLKQTGVTRDWLVEQLRAQGFSDPSEVFIATIDANRKLYVDGYQDKLAGKLDVDDEEREDDA